MTIRLFTETRGRGSDLVLLHGWGLNSGVWEQIVHPLADHCRVTLLDLPGFGRNAGQLPQRYDIESVSDLVCEHLPPKCSLLGWSMGGLVAQKVAIKLGHHLDKLILVASSPRFPQQKDWYGIKPEVLQMFEAQLERDFNKTLDRFLAIQALGSPSSRSDIRIIREQVQKFPTPDETALRNGLRILAETDLRAEIGKIVTPTHRIYGQLDSLVPHKVLESVEALHTSKSIKVFSHASHAPFISHPQEFTNLMLNIMLKER